MMIHIMHLLTAKFDKGNGKIPSSSPPSLSSLPSSFLPLPFPMSDDAATTPVLSTYEEVRARNIEKNNKRLRQLGLISAAEEKRSNDLAWGRNSITTKPYDSEDELASSDEEYTEGKVSTKRKKRIKLSESREGSRKSRRIMNLPAENSNNDDIEYEGESASERKERIKAEREAMVTECREARQRAAIEIAAAGIKQAGKENPTATYEHCLMRVRTMSEKGLANRIRAIERAAGKHCVVKMAIFKSCLQDENMWELAAEAADALERLKGMFPPPTD
jgi:hypothetical protein